MNLKKRSSIRLYICLILAGLLLSHFWPSLAAPLPLTDQQRLKRAWRDAGDIGRYQYRTNVIQTIHPTARLSNAGRHSTTKHFSAAGMIDRSSQDMQLRLWSPGANRDGVELKVENGQAYGRLDATGDWTQVDDNTVDLFAPGGEPLGFLIAAENVQVMEIGNKVPGESAPTPDEVIANPQILLFEGQPSAHYSFDISGPRYAEYMRREMQDQLRREGELPVGVNLGVSKQYIDMEASGELWLDADGLPVRQIIRMQFPPERGGSDWLEAEISTSFYGWEQQDEGKSQASLFLGRLVNDPLTSLGTGLESLTPEKLETLGLVLCSVLILTGLLVLFITHYRSRLFYGALAIAIILSIVATPLMQSGQVFAFGQRMRAKQLETEQQQQAAQAAENLKAETAGRNFNPLANPLPSGNRESENRTPNSYFIMRNLQTSCDLTNSDGDCDGDGLSNGVEQYELGTDPEDLDSDGDYISDQTEVEGFSLNGQTWYLNPLDPDSNGDQLLDSAECPERMDVDPLTGELDTSVTPGDCANTDTDSTPDVFDFDNDGDGVPDSVDSSPNYVGDPSTVAQDQFDLSLTGHDSANKRSLVVDFELRPTNADHLFLADNVYDWPTDDTEGQVTRVFTTTLADEGYDGDKTDYGDMMVVPVLEIKIPAPGDNPDNPSGGLPVQITYTTDITPGTDLDDWLDEDVLEEYSISVSQDEDDGTLYAYLPLTQLEDDVGDTVVAFSAQMYYRPQDDDWVSDHEVRLVWLVEGLIDSCDTSSDSYTGDYDTWCADYDNNWTSSFSIIQSYYDDFYLTGLNVREDYSFDLAVVAQDDALGVDYENYLWQLAEGLQATFGDGLLVTDTQRFDLAEISTRFGPTSTYTTGDERLWDIPADTFSLETGSYDHQVEGLEALVYDHVPNLLASSYDSASIGDTVSLLTAREEVYKTTSLEDDNISYGSGSLTINLSALDKQTYASLSWVPYEYDSDSWASVDIYDYLDLLETNLDNAITDAEVTEMVNWFGEDLDDAATTKTGVISLARNYYLSLYIGNSTMVAASSYGDVSIEIVSDTDINLHYGDNDETVREPVLVIVSKIVDLIQTAFELDGDDSLDEAVEILYAFGEIEQILIEAEESDSTAVTLATSAVTAARSSAKKIAKLFTESGNKIQFYSGRTYVTKATTASGLIAGGLASIYTLTGSTTEILSIVATSMGIVAAAMDAIDTAYSYHRAMNMNWATGLKALAKLERTLRITAVVGLIGDLAIATTIFVISSQGQTVGSLAFSATLADFIAAVIVAVIYAVIAATVVGAIIIAVIGLLDAVFAAICEWTGLDENEDVNTWFCGGVTGAITEIITYIIYDSTPIVNMDADDRLDIALGNATLLAGVEQDGYIKGNQLAIDAEITTTLSMNSPTGLGSFTWRESFFTEDNLKKSVFSYTLESEQTDYHDGLDQGTLTWSNRQEFFEPVGAFTMNTVGLNQPLEIYLNESFKMPALECWGLVIQGCGENTFLDTYHYDFSEQFLFDTFPNSFGGFVALTESGSDGYRQAWDDQFPALWDADGDSVPSNTDPNDSTWDSDGDGLSDYWEMDNGFDPENKDYDGDGLYDYWEEFYGTNPYLADSDGDGLIDGEEFFHSNSRSPYEDDDSTWSGGWTIVYDYDDIDQPMQTMVSADPNDYDTDNDTILDNREFIYGYNPNLSSVLNVLTLNTESSTGVVAPGGSVVYTATIKNELDNRVANGLLQAEFPVDTLQSTQIIGSLYPQMYATLTGAVTAPSVDQTESTSLTLRAGAVIDTSAVNQIFVLNLDEDTGAATFYDATSNRYDFSIATGNPVANSGHVTFDGNDTLQNNTTDSFDQEALSFEAWVKPTATPQGGTTLFDISGQFQVELSTNSEILVQVNNVIYLTGNTALTQDEWTHVVVTYDMDSGELVSYINGWWDATATGVPTITWSASPSYRFALGSLFSGDMDYASLHNYALSRSEVAELASGSLLFYATFDEDECEDYVDSISHQPLTCGYYAYDANEEDTPVSVNGKVNKAVSLVNDYADRTWINFDDDIPLTGDNAFSVGMWLKRPSLSSMQYSRYYRLFDFDFDSAGDTDLTAYVKYNDLYFSLDGCGNFHDLHYNYLPNYNVWHHLGLTYDGDETLTLYIDGEEYDSKSCNTSPTLETLYNIRFGATYDSRSYEYTYDVYVDEPRFYSKALSEEEIAALVEESSRSLHLAFDEPPGQTIFADDSMNSFDGSCIGADCPDSGLAGRNNQAILLDGSANYITLQSASLLGLTESDFTVMAWVKGDAFGSTAQTILGTDSTEGAGNSLQLAVKNGYPYLSLYGSGNDATGTSSLTDDQWYHLAWVF
ncbi:MAG: LamG domain-containing protein, partial [Chloroflexi bacterium]|nr:LamG domain-containing protein [Chloroflexota bacterium]